MSQMNITNYMAEYIANSKIMPKKICEDTGIAESKLILGSQEILDAAEFLSLCQYLNLQPEEIRQFESEKYREGKDAIS